MQGRTIGTVLAFFSVVSAVPALIAGLILRWDSAAIGFGVPAIALFISAIVVGSLSPPWRE